MNFLQKKKDFIILEITADLLIFEKSKNFK